MAFTQTEFKELEKIVKNTKKITAEQLLLIIKEKYVTQYSQIFANTHNNENCVSKVFKNKRSNDSLSKREREQGFKIQTEDRARKYDDSQSRPSVEK